MDKATEPRIYVGTYRKYNSGSILGAWINLADHGDYEEFVNFCKALHSDEADPEFMIQDFEGFPDLFYSESGLPTEETFDDIRKYAEMDSDQQTAFEAYAEMTGKDDTSGDFFAEFEESFAGVYDSKEKYAEQFFEETGGIPDSVPDIIRNNIDWKGIAEEFRIGGDVRYSHKNGQTYVFRNI